MGDLVLVPDGVLIVDSDPAEPVVIVSSKGVKGDPGQVGDFVTQDELDDAIEAIDASLLAKADLVGGVIVTSQIPQIAISASYIAANQAAMLALDAQQGDLAIRTDNGHRYFLNSNTPGNLADWIDLGASTDAVSSVNGQVGIVVLGKGDVGLPNVDNTSDANKPLSLADLAAGATYARTAATTNRPLTGALSNDGINHNTGDRVLLTAQTDAKENGVWVVNTAGAWSRPTDMSSSAGYTPGKLIYILEGNTLAGRFYRVAGIAAPVVGVDNISIGTLVATPLVNSIFNTHIATGASIALAKLASIANDRLVGNVSGASASPVELTAAQVRTLLAIANVDNTSDANKPISTAQQTALDAKQPLADQLTKLAALSYQNNQYLRSTGTGWILRSPASVKSDLALDQVTNTADADKPVSTAQQTALDAKVDDSQLSANGMGYVNHGSNASTARPSGFASVTWLGSVEPTNMVNGDFWAVSP